MGGGSGRQAGAERATHICVALVLEVDEGDLLVELCGAVPLLLGVEVELEDPHRSVGAADCIVSRIPHHDLNCPVPENSDNE